MCHLVDGVSFRMKGPFDFSFLAKYGKVFKVFDDQDSGNICFGVESTGGRRFVKFAGAPTERADVSKEQAIDILRNTVPVYRDLAHPNLVKLMDAEEVGGGFAMVFQWTDALCMGRQYPESHKKIMSSDIETRLRIFEEVLDFHLYVAKCNYVAIDFYDGSIMYDFDSGRTLICDIDCYEKAPYTNQMGRMWGSSRFMSPEEFSLGAAIDEVTNVYTMGAAAFALLAGYDRSAEAWPLGRASYDVVKKAVSDERSLRQQSVKQLIDEWELAK